MIAEQDSCIHAIIQYFTPALYHQDANTKQRFLQNLLPDALLLDDGCIQQLYAAKNGRRLHKVIIDAHPLSLGSWMEFGEVSSQLNDFFAAVNSLTINPVCQSANRLPVIRNDIR